MTKLEQLKSLIKNKSYDVGHPVLFHPILMQFAARFNNHTYTDLMKDYKVRVESNVKCLEHFNLDWVTLMSDPYCETSAFGAKVVFSGNNTPKCQHIVKTLEDIESLENPDVCNCERTIDRMKAAEYYKKLLGNDYPIVGWIEGPLAEACDLADVNDILLKVIMEPVFVKTLMDKCMITAKAFAKAQVEAGCNVIGVGDAICSQISTEMYQELVLPLHIELFEYIHLLGAITKLHICGDITHLLPNIKNLQADIVDLDWMVDMTHAHEVLGDNFTLCGNLNPVNCIQDLPAREVYEQTAALLEKEKGKNFILSGGCEITVDTPVENLQAMREASL